MKQLGTLADLKRIMQVGVTVTMLKHDWYPYGPLIGMPRKITKIQGNGGKFEGGSWFYYPAARQLKFEGGLKFSVPLDDDGARVYYEVEGEET